jgi:hypothetical protein
MTETEKNIKWEISQWLHILYKLYFSEEQRQICNAGGYFHGLEHSRQVTLPLNYIPNPFSGRVSLWSSGWPSNHYASHASLQPSILLPLPSKCWDYRCIPPYPDEIKILHIILLIFTEKRVIFLLTYPPVFKCLTFLMLHFNI